MSLEKKEFADKQVKEILDIASRYDSDTEQSLSVDYDILVSSAGEAGMSEDSIKKALVYIVANRETGHKIRLDSEEKNRLENLSTSFSFITFPIIGMGGYEFYTHVMKYSHEASLAVAVIGGLP